MQRPSSPPPWWISALDALCLVLIAYAISAMLGHRVRIAFRPVYISLASWPRLLFWTAVILVARHAVWRTPAAPAHLVQWARGSFGAEPFRAAFPAFAVSRAATLFVGYIAVVTIGFNPPRPWRALDNRVLDLFARWDAGWYAGIANVWYHADRQFDPTHANSIAFFPGLPMLMRVVRHTINVNLWIAGIVVVLVSFLLALVCLYRLAREDMPADQARAALLFLAFYPFAVCYSAVLTESVFLLTASGSFLYFRRNQLVKAALFALATGIVRPNGFLLCVPLGLLAVMPFARSRGWLPGERGTESQAWGPLVVKLAVAALPVASMACYAAYVYSLTGDPFAWAKAQQAWGRQTALIVDVVNQRSDLIATSGLASYPGQYPIELMEGAAALFGLIAVWPIIRRFGLAYGAFVAMAIVPPLITMGAVSLGRYTAPLFPIFLWLGATVPERRRSYWIGAFAAGQALIAVLFYTWRPPY